MNLTPEERDIVICDNLDLIHYHLNKHYWKDKDNEDVYQLCVEALIRCVDSYDENSPYAFSTYACKAFDYAVAKYVRKEVKPRISGTLCNFKDGVIPEYLLTEDDIDFQYFDNTDIKKFLDTLTKKDKEIVKYRLKGHSAAQVGRDLGCSRKYISARLKTLQKKYTNWYNENYIIS